MKKTLTALFATVVALTVGATQVGAQRPNVPATVVDVAVGASGTPNTFDANHDDFDILVAAVLALELDDDLAARGQRTVFAPTDEAFMDLAETLTGTAPADEAAAFATVAGVPDVAKIVKYHVVNGNRLAESVVPADQLRTITKQFIDKEPGAAALDAGLGRTANIVLVDQMAGNGVVHGIDAVLLP